MIEATKRDKSLVIDILAKAFEENKSVNYVIRQGRGKVKRIKKLIAYSFNICNEFGKVYISPDKQGCAMILFPEKKRTSLKTIFWDLQVALFSFGIRGTRRAMAREKIIHKEYPKDTPFIYLWFIGVNPEHQNKGTGGSIMKKLTEIAKIKDRPIYLETSSEDNVSFYAKYGLNIYCEDDFGYRLYFIKN